jgi:GPH family glycoside/pentoside/hexuronide:cation symporter
MPVAKLTLGKELAYACGMVGWSIMTNLITVMLLYFYLPPSNAGLVILMPQIMVFGFFNILSIIAASGRFADALFDPFIASLSDGSKNPAGRRIPFMKWAILPAVVFCCLTFYPWVMKQSGHNAAWLAVTMTLFFMSVTAYIIPYNALLPELTETSEEKVRLSSFQQAGFVIGIIIAASVNNYADGLQHFFPTVNRDAAVQYTIWSLAVIAGVVMLVPIFAIDEKKYSTSKPSHLPILLAIRKTFSNRNFKYYLISDFSFYMALSVISSGMLYFVTVLLGLPESMGGALMGAMVILSLFFYPLINSLSKKIGKKPLVIFSFGLMSLIFVAIYFLGKFPVSPYVQVYALVLCAAFPLAALGILPTAILAEIAQDDAKKTGENREGMFFAVRYLFVKMGQTLGIALFAFLTVYGKDPGNDHGLRLNGICGFVLCLGALIFFSRFKEKRPIAITE